MIKSSISEHLHFRTQKVDQSIQNFPQRPADEKALEEKNDLRKKKRERENKNNRSFDLFGS